jgi:hypothetical protein
MSYMAQWRRRATIAVGGRSWRGHGQGRRATSFHALPLSFEDGGPHGGGWEGFVHWLSGSTNVTGRPQRAWRAQLGRVEDVSGTIDAREGLCT